MSDNGKVIQFPGSGSDASDAARCDGHIDALLELSMLEEAVQGIAVVVLYRDGSRSLGRQMRDGAYPLNAALLMLMGAVEDLKLWMRQRWADQED